MPRDPFTASLEYRRRFITDRWWLLAAVLVAAGGILMATITSFGWLLIIAGLVVFIYGLVRGTGRAE